MASVWCSQPRNAGIMALRAFDGFANKSIARRDQGLSISP